jgi:colicin import membrane protein
MIQEGGPVSTHGNGTPSPWLAARREQLKAEAEAARKARRAEEQAKQEAQEARRKERKAERRAAKKIARALQPKPPLTEKQLARKRRYMRSYMWRRRRALNAADPERKRRLKARSERRMRRKKRKAERAARWAAKRENARLKREALAQRRAEREAKALEKLQAEALIESKKKPSPWQKRMGEAVASAMTEGIEAGRRAEESRWTSACASIFGSFALIGDDLEKSLRQALRVAVAQQGRQQ